jgi:hypothetical protein
MSALQNIGFCHVTERSFFDNSTLGSWQAREEARELWDRFPCDSLVYVAQLPNADLESSHVFAEKYVGNDLWFHIRWSVANPRNAGDDYGEVVLEANPSVSNRAQLTATKVDCPVAAIDGNSAVFVEVPEFVELPEVIRVYGVRSIARLKRIENAVDAGMEHGPLLPVGFIGSADGKDNLIGLPLRFRDGIGEEMHQVPCELIQRSTEIVHEVPDCERNILRRRMGLDYEHVLRSLRIILFPDGVRVAFNPVPNLSLSRLEVKVSPSGFHVHVFN